MDAGDIISIGRQTVWIIIKTSVPILLVSMIVGLIISLLQTLTSIQEQTLTFVPKFLAILVTIVICGNWIMNCITTYMTELCKNFSVYIQ